MPCSIIQSIRTTAKISFARRSSSLCTRIETCQMEQWKMICKVHLNGLVSIVLYSFTKTDNLEPDIKPRHRFTLTMKCDHYTPIPVSQMLHNITQTRNLKPINMCTQHIYACACGCRYCEPVADKVGCDRKCTPMPRIWYNDGRSKCSECQRPRSHPEPSWSGQVFTIIILVIIYWTLLQAEERSKQNDVQS